MTKTLANAFNIENTNLLKLNDYEIFQDKQTLEKIKNDMGMNTSQFAKYIDTTIQQLSYVLKGERGFSISKLIEIAEKTGYPIEYILTGKSIDTNSEIRNRLKKINMQIQKINEEIKDLNKLIS